jgi:Family of unknown function (DUF5996)
MTTSGLPRLKPLPWSVPLDEDDRRAHDNTGQVGDYFAAATQAALALAAFRAPYRGRPSPVNAWWGTFDLAVFLFSGRSAGPPSDDFILRNPGTARSGDSAGTREAVPHQAGESPPHVTREPAAKHHAPVRSPGRRRWPAGA